MRMRNALIQKMSAKGPHFNKEDDCALSVCLSLLVLHAYCMHLYGKRSETGLTARQLVEERLRCMGKPLAFKYYILERSGEGGQVK